MLYEVITFIRKIGLVLVFWMGMSMFGGCGSAGVEHRAIKSIEWQTLDSGTRNHLRGVITSYSIHYTKLYEDDNTYKNNKSIYPYISKFSLFKT